MKKSTETDESDSDSKSEDDDTEDMLNEDPASRIAYLTALSRGEIDCSSTDEDSSSEDEGGEQSSDDESSLGGEESIYGKAGILDPSTKEEGAEITYDKSRYMAACNMDWTNVCAVDLLSIVSSFYPPGSVKFVHVYPSDFGMERMEKDKMFGPLGVWKKTEDKYNQN